MLQTKGSCSTQLAEYHAAKSDARCILVLLCKYIFNSWLNPHRFRSEVLAELINLAKEESAESYHLLMDMQTAVRSILVA
mmetsp:Transcript_8729/g.10446  ORF Transcript_8729/g.10446 Transcript_8729/m.10446 type:complete len:80 (+) Transcript_8729:959-1198(+)